MRPFRQRSSASLARLARRGRELPALGLALVWLFGVVLAPLVHLGLHGALAPHSHSASALASTRHEGHCHEGHCHEGHGHEGHGHEGRGVDRSEHAGVEGAAKGTRETPADHGRSSPLHGHVAALFPAPALVIPPFVAIGERAIVASTDDVIDALPAPVGLARGPPHA